MCIFQTFPNLLFFYKIYLKEFDKTILLRSMLQKSSFYLDKYDYDLMLYLIFFNLTYESERPKGDYVLKEENKEKSKSYIFYKIQKIIFFFKSLFPNGH